MRLGRASAGGRSSFVPGRRTFEYRLDLSNGVDRVIEKTALLLERLSGALTKPARAHPRTASIIAGSPEVIADEDAPRRRLSIAIPIVRGDEQLKRKPQSRSLS